MQEKRCRNYQYQYQYMTNFEQFWAKYPRKVGKLAAKAAYEKAIRDGKWPARVMAEHIMVGLDAYLQHLPADREFIVHPKTWLRQGRWLDEYEPFKPPPVDWHAECQLIHGGACGLNQTLHHTRKLIDAGKVTG